MRLRPVRFVGHKIGPFEHIELNWNKDSHSTLIVGENGSGKTTLVAVIAACLLKHPEDSYDVFYKFTQDDSSFAYFEVIVNEGDNISILRRRGNRNDRFKQVEKFLDFDAISVAEHNSSWIVSGDFSQISRFKDVDFLLAAYGVSRNINHENITGYKELNSSPLQAILNPFVPIQSGEVFQWITNQYINYAMAMVDKQENEANAYLTNIEKIKQFLKDNLNISLDFEVVRNPLQLKVKMDNKPISVNQLSDGTRSFLSWILDYLMRASRVNWADPKDSAIAPGLVLVDEIDSHLHPEWQRRVMSSVAQLLPETYVIATTHSPFVVASAKDAQIFRLYRDEQGKIAVDSNEDGLYGYPADLVLKKEFLIDSELYPPEIEAELKILSELMGKVTFNVITESERREHDRLLKKLSKVSPWLDSLLTLSQVTRSIND